MLEYIKHNLPLLTFLLAFISFIFDKTLAIIKELRDRRKERLERLTHQDSEINENGALPPRKVTHRKR